MIDCEHTPCGWGKWQRATGGRARLYALLAGAGALVWLLLRSGTKPSRLTYPCQQAAGTAVAAAVVSPFVAAGLWLRRRVLRGGGAGWGRLCAALVLVAGVSIGLWSAGAPSAPGIAYTGGRSVPPGYRASVYVIDGARGPDGQRFGGLDDLIVWMGLHGQTFYRSESGEGFERGPEGIIGAGDVVVIKINYQWDQRGGTNVDLLRGLVRRVVDHPDGFAGEVVVCENAQFNSTSNFDRGLNNAESYDLSPHDVVTEFQGQGHRVSHFDWTVIRGTQVGEYSTGNMTDGYVVGAYDAGLQGRVSYPKFRTAQGTYVSLRYGVWNAGAYDRGRLKFINVPVLKSHHSTYGVTACVKHYMGVVTGVLDTNSHNAIRNGILGALTGDIGLADLNILDCIWINANPFSGPATTYAGATRIDKLVAGTDPVALDRWAAKNVLIPAFVANGYSPPWPAPSADPDDPASAFRVYLDNSMNRMIAAGHSVTNDPARIDAARWDGQYGTAGDVNGDGAIDGRDAQAFVDVLLGANNKPLWMLRSDVDGDRDVDVEDVGSFVAALVGV